MSNTPDLREDDDIPETDFSGGVRGKYYERAMHGSNVVPLEPDGESLSEHEAPPTTPRR